MTYSAPPPMTIDQDAHYTATIVTEKGDLVVELFAKDVPVTVNNFVFLAREGFYDNTPIHRVEPGFVIQAGYYTPDGRRARTSADPIPNESENGLSNLRGTVAGTRVPRSQRRPRETRQRYPAPCPLASGRAHRNARY